MEDKTSKSITDEPSRIVGETSKLSIDKRQEDPENRSSDEASKLSKNKFQDDSEALGLSTNKKIITSETQGSPELRRKLSKTAAVREDARNLKSATIDRMGKIFKLKSNRTLDEGHENYVSRNKVFEKTVNSQEDQQSRKEKTNSLGRMLKLVDKNGEPRKLFNNSRSGSLSHMFRRKSTGAQDDKNSNENSNNMGVFSRMLNQWRNRSKSGNPTTEPNLCSSFPEENISLSSKPSSTSKLNHSSDCTFPTTSHSSTATTVVKNVGIEFPA